MVQLGLQAKFPDFYAPAPTVDAKGNVRLVRPWMVVRNTSVGLYEYLKDSGKLAEGRWVVLNAVAYLKNCRGYWPTGCEVLSWLFATGQIPDMNPNHVKPRLNELADGWDHWVTTTVINGVKVREKVHVHCDLLVRGPRRKSRVTGISCLTWEVRTR
jgi:hypothetical protein